MPQQPPTMRRFGSVRAEAVDAPGELGRVALVELRRLVELGVGHPGRVGTQALDPAEPSAVVGVTVALETRRDVGRVGAVDDEVVGRGLRVDARDRVAQRGAVGQPAVGLDGEADRAGSPASRTARTKPIASPAPVMVSTVTWSAPAAAAARTWVAW